MKKLLFVSNLFPDTREPYRGLDNATLLPFLKSFDTRAVAVRPTLPFRKGPARTPRVVDKRFEPIYLDTLYVPKFGSHFNHHLFASALKRPLLELKKRFPFDVILVAWTFPDTAAIAKLQSELNVPFVGIVQGSDAHVYLRIQARRKTIVDALNRSAGAITRSAKLAELLRDAGVQSGKLHPVYNGVDLDTFHPEANKKNARQKLNLKVELPTILFVGNFLPVKNPHLLVRAHAEVCKNIPCQLVMLGGGPLEAEVRALANELGHGENVILAGRKNASEVARHMQAADLLCLSSENEGVPNVVLEAFASGIPVVSTDVGGIHEVLNKPFLGRLVDRGNQQQLSQALTAVLNEQSQTEKIREHGLNFSWPKAAVEYERILNAAAR